MTHALFPELTIEMHGRLREAWLEHVQADAIVPALLVVGDRLAEPALLERDYLRRIARNPGTEVDHRLGRAPKAQPGSISIQQGHVARLANWYAVGVQAILRLVATGRQFGASDLDVLVADGPVHSRLRPVFDDATNTLVLAQRELHVRFGDRIARVGAQATPAPSMYRALER